MHRDKCDWAESKRLKETELRTNLFGSKNSATVVNVLFSWLLKYVGFKSSESSSTLEPLLPEETYVFFDNIEVERIEVRYYFS